MKLEQLKTVALYAHSYYEAPINRAAVLEFLTDGLRNGYDVTVIGSRSHRGVER